MTKKTRIAATVGGAAGLIVALTLILLWPRHRAEGVFASGTVEVTETDLGFQVPGRIDSVLVREGDSVRVGEVLGRLDRAELEARRRAAEGQRAAPAAPAPLPPLPPEPPSCAHAYPSQHPRQRRRATGRRCP